MTMMRASVSVSVSVAALLCCGAAAQEVTVGGTPCKKTRADEAVGEGYGSGKLVMVADWLAQPQADYFHVPDFTSESLVLTPDVAGSPPMMGQATECRVGWAKSAADSAVCLGTPGVVRPPNLHAWTNLIEPGQRVRDVPVYAPGETPCKGGAMIATIDVTFSGTTITVDLTNGGQTDFTRAAVYVGLRSLPEINGGQPTWNPGLFPEEVGIENGVVTFDDLDAGMPYYFAVVLRTCTTPPPPACASKFYVTQYHCGHGPCTEGISGNLGALLVGDGWEVVKAWGTCFTHEGTGAFPHETRVFAKEITEEYTSPATEGETRYVGVFATGCGGGVTPPPPSVKPGPVRSLCRENCPPGSDGFVR